MTFLRMLTTLTVSGMLAAVAVFAVAAPAQAADINVKIQSRSDGRCAATSGLRSGLIRPACTYAQTRWRYQPRSTSPSGRPLVKFQSLYNNGCMDTNGGGWNAAVLTIGCNTGNNQLWEVFAVGSYYVYKSWGAWTGRGEHLCLYADPAFEERLRTCATSAYNQQWARLGA